MAEKKFTKEQERAYWQGKREACIAMSRRMLDEHWDFCARCGAHFMDRRYVAELCDLDV